MVVLVSCPRCGDCVSQAVEVALALCPRRILIIAQGCVVTPYALVVVARGGPVEDKHGARARARRCHRMRWPGVRMRCGAVVVDLVV